MSVSGVISHKPVIYKIWGIVPGCNWVISKYKGEAKHIRRTVSGNHDLKSKNGTRTGSLLIRGSQSFISSYVICWCNVNVSKVLVKTAKPSNGHFKILGVENWLVILSVFCFFPSVHRMFLDGWFFTAPTRYELLVNICHAGEEANTLSRPYSTTPCHNGICMESWLDQGFVILWMASLL